MRHQHIRIVEGRCERIAPIRASDRGEHQQRQGQGRAGRQRGEQWDVHIIFGTTMINAAKYFAVMGFLGWPRVAGEGK